MRSIRFTLILSVFTLSGVVQAQPAIPASFERHRIPLARCGDGSPYEIYIRRGDPSRVFIPLEGGGACWSKETCFGNIKFTKLHIDPTLSKGGYLGPQLENNPFNDFTYVYLPYCSGDIFAGTHVADYDGKRVVHEGRKNVSLSLDWVKMNLRLESASDVVAYGESAGALGVMLNLDQIHEATPMADHRLALVDSPGLHFSRQIWKRFSPPYMMDLKRSLQANGITLDTRTGVLAPQLHSFCAEHSPWKIGFTQATRDLIMSLVFGQITMIHHRARVLGKNGIAQQLQDPADNCASWVPEETQHVYSIYAKWWQKRVSDGTSNGDFVRELYTSQLSDPHPSHK